MIREYSDCPYMPDWAIEAGDNLESILNALAKGPENVATQLDWAMKYTLFNQYLEKNYHTSFNDNPSNLQSAKDLRTYRQIEIRNKLAELDIRFGEFGENGIFNKMDSDGVLNHKMVPQADINFAVDNPPADTRAMQRGKWISDLYQTKYSMYLICDWDKIINTKNERWLDFRSPFTESASWKNTDKEY